MAHENLSGAVGLGGANRVSDVAKVQNLLMSHGVNPGKIDGRSGPLTVRAILHFQSALMAHPDGRVDPSGKTWRHLVDQGQKTSPSFTAARPSLVKPAVPPIVAKPTMARPVDAKPLVAPLPNITADCTKESMLTRVPKPKKDEFNQNVKAASNQLMLNAFGHPRDNYSQNDQPVTNEKLRALIVTENVGPFRVTGLRPAVESLRKALSDVQRDIPSLYKMLGTAGMLNCRLQRGSNTAISNHSWGTAIDIKLNGLLDARGDNKVYMGLKLMAPIMNAHGWYWGAVFRTEDAMHFEAGRSLITQWASLI